MADRTANAFDAAVGRAVRLRRAAVGVSQEKLARAIGVSFQQVQKYENGSNRISASRLDAIAVALGCATADLLPANEPNAGLDTPEARFLASREFRRVAAAFDGITDPEMRRRLVKVLQLFAADPSEGATADPDDLPHSA